MRAKGFTLIELLVVIAIIAILAAFIFPVLVQAKAAVETMGVGRNGKQIYTAAALYQADSDDTFPLAMYADGPVMQAWFGRQIDTYRYDNSLGLLSPYIKGKVGRDPTLVAEDWMGDETGIGYNWGVIGSDMHERNDYSQFPNCTGAATSTSLENASRTVVFATSAFYNVSWIPGGDGKKHLFNFFDPMEFWNNVPNVDFRHQGTVTVDNQDHVVRHNGRAIFIFADGNTRTYKKGELKRDWFWREPLAQ
ncbi:MAG: prepilin-type N-terminal cleavage/methylation domain-containing protein [Armatimonadetes bacterium]|nr:prepilin-type N-terminal cleavage/methylation domain-containing protein [Armatimonadota bacterium]MBS1710383.1 prepilin-type N-terminal cleavage/methylation domain-containing protein [Armatimonadota bacterium]MBX3108980.1 prepilin-type N-terminal cleavage/methylation domain-containing protein [Fimbriimonadaceae bacterium]